MSIRDEIAALRAEIEARRSKPSAAVAASSESPNPRETPADGDSGAPSVDAFIRMISETLDELPKELDLYPRLTALVTFGVGLALGALIGRQSR